MGYIGEFWHMFMFLQAIQFEILKFPWKNAKNYEKIRKLLAPSIFETKKMCLVCITQYFGSTEKSLVRKSLLTKTFFSRRSAYEILWPSQLGGNLLGECPPSGVQNYDLDGFYLVWHIGHKHGNYVFSWTIYFLECVPFGCKILLSSNILYNSNLWHG